MLALRLGVRFSEDDRVLVLVRDRGGFPTFKVRRQPHAQLKLA